MKTVQYYGDLPGVVSISTDEDTVSPTFTVTAIEGTTSTVQLNRGVMQLSDAFTARHGDGEQFGDAPTTILGAIRVFLRKSAPTNLTPYGLPDADGFVWSPNNDADIKVAFRLARDRSAPGELLWGHDSAVYTSEEIDALVGDSFVNPITLGGTIRDRTQK